MLDFRKFFLALAPLVLLAGMASAEFYAPLLLAPVSVGHAVGVNGAFCGSPSVSRLGIAYELMHICQRRHPEGTTAYDVMYVSGSTNTSRAWTVCYVLQGRFHARTTHSFQSRFLFEPTPPFDGKDWEVS